MSKLDELKTALNTKAENKKLSKTPGFGWEIGAYSIRGVTVALPAVIIMFMENSWVKTGIGLTATLLIIALVIVFKEPIKKAMGYAPGVIPFTLFVIVAIFFSTVSHALLTIGISGLGGSVASMPLHLKYLSAQEDKKTPEQILLERIANAVDK